MNRLTEHFFQTSVGIFSQTDVTMTIKGSRFSRHGLIKRAIANGEILKIRRGLYCLAPAYQKKPVSIYGISEYIYGPSYISFETALSYHGWIPESVYVHTCASCRNSKEFKTPLGIFSYKHVPQETFYADVERCVDSNGNVYFMASAVKALTDYVYARKPGWTSINDAAKSLRIEPVDLYSVNVQQLSALTENYNNGRVKHFLNNWKESLKS